VEPEWQQVLSARRAELIRQLADLRAEVAEVIDAARDANLDDEHDPEGSTVAFERAQLARLTDSAAEELTEVEHAMTRLAEARYGRCEQCGQLIGDERLTARPTTRFCIRCAERRSR
jgi:DnaK suppressor protein